LIRYEKFFNSTLERKYDSLHQIDLREELTQWDSGYPNTVAHQFYRRGYKTIGDLEAYFHEENPNEIRNLGKVRIEVAREMVKKYKSESLLDINSSCDTYSFSKDKAGIKKEENLKTHTYYLTDISRIHMLDYELCKINAFSMTLINTCGEYNMIINIDDVYGFKDLSKEQSIIKTDAKSYYSILRYLNQTSR